MTEAPDDPYRWLEEIDGRQALDWVAERNAETTAPLTADPAFQRLRGSLLEVLDAEERIPLTRWRGGHMYNLWRDAEHPRGLWRRTTLAEYRGGDPRWEVLIDVDALAEAEGERWVWQGVTVLRPDHDRALVSLSRGGKDACVVREFDLRRLAFVAGGFQLPEAKSSVGWIDADTIYVGTDTGPGSLTTSGYPRIVREWRRGTPLADAAVVFEGQPGDVSATAHHDPTPGHERSLVARMVAFFHTEWSLRTPGGLVRIEVPRDAEIDAHRRWLLVRLRSPWTVGGATHPAGALLAADLDAFLAGDRTLSVLFEPDEHTALESHAWTRHHLVLTTLRDVRSRLEVLTPPADGVSGWRRAPLPGVPEYANTEVADTDPFEHDEMLLLSSGYTAPATLRHTVLGGGRDELDGGRDGGLDGGRVTVLREEPAFFDVDGLTVRQRFAVSDDGTRVPYFLVGAEGGGPAPTLLNGYGGFEISRTPAYSGVVGRGWLARGGRYAVANIRGGGEYGPPWHRAALRDQRPRAYEDFAAVARDLVATGVTTVAQLGVEGGSNGGLLTGVMYTRYPQLFGAVVSQVPLLDMRRYHRLLAGASWMAEFGDPDDDADWAYLRRFSPYHNVRHGVTYPPVLFATSTKDDRVHPGHARKMVALLRERGLDVTYYENVEGGHGGAADNAQVAFKWALVFDFLWRRLTGSPR